MSDLYCTRRIPTRSEPQVDSHQSTGCLNSSCCSTHGCTPLRASCSSSDTDGTCNNRKPAILRSQYTCRPIFCVICRPMFWYICRLDKYSPIKFNGLMRVAVFLDMVMDEKVDKVVDGVNDMVWDMRVDNMTSVVVNGCGG